MENGLAVGFHGYLLPGHGNQLGSCHKNPPGLDSLLLKGKFPLVCRRAIIFDGKKSLWDPCIFRNTSPIPPTLWTLDAKRQELQELISVPKFSAPHSVHCLQGRSWFWYICLSPRSCEHHRNGTPARPHGWSCRPSCHASASFFTSSVSWKPNKNDSKRVKTCQVRWKICGMGEKQTKHQC